jgi:ArsR family transcriptional regulator
MEFIQFTDLGSEKADKLAVMMKALSHPVRLQIVQQLSEGSDANCCVDFTRHASLAQSTISQHLRVLKEAGLIKLCGDGPRSGWCIERSAMVWLKQQVVAL